MDHCQITWSALGPGHMTVEVDGPDGSRHLEFTADGGPGSLVVTDVGPGDRWARVSGAGMGETIELRFTTLARPAGALLARVATISDCHLGTPSTGYFHTLREAPDPDVDATSRCLTGALAELSAWGAELLVVKGDLVDASNRHLWAEAAERLATVDIPTLIVPGNHEYARHSDVDPFEGAAAVGLDLVDHVRHVDLAEGRVRVVAADVGRVGADSGRLDHVTADIVDAVTGAEASLVAFHQQAMRFSFPTHIPPGIPGPQATRLCRALAATGTPTLVTSGHTHRNRRRDVRGVTVTEVGSTRDFPGVWAGYEFYEGGVVQTVHRIAEPSCIRWTDFTRRSALGVWAKWAPGSLDDRCFALEWR